MFLPTTPAAGVTDRGVCELHTRKEQQDRPLQSTYLVTGDCRHVQTALCVHPGE